MTEVNFFTLRAPTATRQPPRWRQYYGAFYMERMAMASAFTQTQAAFPASRTYITGMALVIAAGTCLSFGGLLFRLISSSDVWQVFLYRSVFLILAMVPIILYANKGKFFSIFYQLFVCIEQ